MTSVKYLSSWIREAGRGHVTAVLSWGGFFIYTALAVFELHADASSAFFGIGSGSLLSLCTGLGILVAAAEFWYLEQPAKLDFYYSLPVKRGTVFWCRYAHGALHVLLALVVGMAVCGIYECTVDKDFLLFAAGYTFRSIFIFAAVFFIFYHVSIVSFLAGGIFVSVLVFFVMFMFTGQVIFQGIGKTYAKHFFRTFYRIPVLEDLKEMLTPALLSRKLVGTSIYNKRDLMEYVPEGRIIAAVICWILLFAVLILYLERKRKVENVGKVFAFSVTERGVGKKLPGRKWLLPAGVPVVLFLLVAGAFAVSAGSFDGFLPEEGELEAIRICVNGVDMSGESCARNVLGEESYQTEDKLSQYRLTKDGLTEGLLWIRDLVEGEDAGSGGYTFVTVCYQMKDGKERYRAYPVSETEFQAFSRIFETREYKEKAYPALLWEDVGDNRFTWKDGVGSGRILEFTREEKETFLALYKEEVLTFSMKELYEAPPAGIVEMHSDKWGETEDLLIYPFFEKTYAFLLEHGGIKGDLLDYQVRSVRVLDMEAKDAGLTGGITAERYETEEELKEWRGRLVWEELDVQPLLYPLSSGTEIEAEIEEPESGALVTVKCFEKEKRE